MALAEGGEEPAVFALKDLLDSDVATGRQDRAQDAVAGREAVLIRLPIDPNCAAIRPQACVAASPRASSKPSASSP